MGRAGKTSPHLLKRKQKSWVWTDFQVQAWRPVMGLPQTVCLREAFPGCTQGNSPQPSGKSFGCPHSPCSPLCLPNMFPRKKNELIHSHMKLIMMELKFCLLLKQIELLRLRLNSKKSLLESFHEENELHVLQALSAMVSLCGRHCRELHARGSG